MIIWTGIWLVDQAGRVSKHHQQKDTKKVGRSGDFCNLIYIYARTDGRTVDTILVAAGGKHVSCRCSYGLHSHVFPEVG